jgi:DnaJ-domain-containing protein 1
MPHSVLAMERRLAEWKIELDRIWSAHLPDYDEAIRLAQQIAGSSEEELLRQAASQALPILRSAAAHEEADHATREAARRRLGVIREVLSALTTPQFGKRTAAVKLPTPEERCRALLGLPLERRLSEAEIHRAYKRLAKRAHPDAGGNSQAFLELSAAQDTLMKERRTPQRH